MIKKWYKTRKGSDILYSNSIVFVVEVIGDVILYKYTKGDGNSELEGHTFKKQLGIFLTQVIPLTELEEALL